VRYKERSVWYIDGIGSSGSEVDGRRVCRGELSVDSWVRWILLQYLVQLVE
jgi:hypothetical protein